MKRLLVLALVVACGGPLPHERRQTRAALQQRLRSFDTPGLVVGEFALAEKAVLDGDTIKLKGMDTTLRLLAVDAEETFKYDKERRAYEVGWEHYKKTMRGDSSRPVKYATPVGDAGKDWAKQFFAGVKTVILERDHPKEIRDFFNRYLGYLIVIKDGKRLNFNVELVRAGYSPYFTKYGQSRRFHAEFVAAENEARAAGRGIWDPTRQHYDDYDERKRWWDARGEFIARFEAEAEGKDNYVPLTNWDALTRLEGLIGKEAVVLGSVGSVRRGDKGPTRVMLAQKAGQDFPLIFFDKDLLGASGIEKHAGEYIAVKGFITKYTDEKRGRYQLQMVVNLPGQILGASGP